MEACLMKPEVKKRPKPPKPPPKPTETSRTEIDSFLKPAPAERPTPVQRQTPPQRPVPVQRKTPVVPQRPTDSELSHTQYRLKRPEVNGNVSQETKYKPTETPVVPPRPTEQELKSSRQYSQHRREQAHDTQSSKETNHATSTEGPKDKTDFRQTNGLGVTGALWKSQKEKSPLFTSYVTESTEEKSDLTQQAPAGSKPGGLKGVMKSLQFKTSPKVSRDSSPDPGSVEASTEDEKSAEKQKNNAGLKQRSELSTSTDSLSENKEKGGIFSGMFKKSPKTTENEEIEAVTSEENLSENNNNNKAKEKGGVFSGMFKKSPKPQEEPEREEGEEGLLHSELSASSDSLSENKEKGGLFSGLLKKTPKAAAEEKQPLDDEISTSSETSESSAKEKGGIFGGIFKKAHKPVEDAQTDEENSDKELSTSSENLSEKKQEKGGVFSGLLKKTPKTSAEKTESPDEEDQKELRGSNEDLTETNTNKEKKIFSNLFKRQKTVEDTAAEKENSGDELSTSAENLSENKQDKGIFSGLLKKTPKTPKERTASPEREEETKASNDDLTETNKEKNKFTNLFKKPQKPAEGATAEEDQEENGEDLSGSCENLFASAAPKEKKGGFAGIFKRSASIDNLFDSEDNIFTDLFKKPNKNAEGKSADEDSLKPLSSSCENLPEATKTKEKSGGFASMFKKSPKPAPRSVTNEDPLSDSQFEFGSCDSIPDMIVEENLSASNDDLSTKEKKTVFSGMFKRTPKPAEPQEGEDVQPATGIGIKRRKTIKKKQRVVSFRIKKTLPRLPKLAAQDADKMPIIEETVELQDLNTVEENAVEVEPVEMAAYPTEENPVETEEEDDELMDWWKTVAGWAEWIETSNQEENEEEAMEEAADRVYMAARLFVQLFNQRGASLQHRIMELMAFADAADQFHKKTVSAAVGGGVASVAGSVATITGLILAPFTFGASIIVTAVGIGVATAGSITSATANITDTVHSNMDRKKVEKMIQGYQQEMKDIRECLEFVQEGMDTLQEWDFEKFSESAAKKALNHNIKHVVKEGGRAGKALMINTDKLISTVQVLGAAGGVAKAAKAISVTTGVMSALFLALDIFFLAKDSHELRKGAKTKFATKIREVCKDLQDGLLELNKVKTQLQKTMDGIEVEEYEEIQEVEEEVEDDLESDPVKLAELEQELDLMEEKLDKRVEEERKRKEEEEKKRREEEAKAAKEKLQEESEDEEEGDYDLKKGKDDAKKLKSEKEIKGKAVMDEEKTEQGIYSVKESIKEFFKDPILKVTKKDKDMENKITADKEKSEKDKSVLSKKTHKKEASLSGKELLDAKDEEKLEKVKSQKDGDMAKQKETAKDEKSKVKSQKESQTAKQEAKTEEKVMSPRESKTGQDSKVEEKVSVKSLRESWMAKQENADEKVSVKSLKMTKQEDTTNVDEKVKNLRESWMAKQENPDGKVSVKSLKEANKREDMTNVDEKVKNLRESWLAKEKIADEKVSVKSLKQEDTTNVDEKVKNLRESWLTKEDKTKDITKKEEKVTSPRESHKTHQEMTTQEEKVSVKSPRESHSSRKVEGVEIRHKAEWRSEKKKQVRERGEEEVESSRRHSSSRSDSDKSSFRSNRSKHERKTEEEKGVKTRDHHEAALRRERSDREGQNSRVEIDHNRTSHNEKRERSTRNHFERADKAEEEERSKKKSQKGSDSDRESGRGHRESGRSHTESGRSHRDGDRESRRSHREGHLRESDRRREHGGSRPRSNALLEDGLYI